MGFSSLFLSLMQANFQAKVKKIPSSVPCQSTGLRPGPGRWSFSHGLRCHCVWVGQGFGGFLDLREKVFFLIQCPGAVLPPAGRVFFFFCMFEEKKVYSQIQLNGLYLTCMEYNSGHLA